MIYRKKLKVSTREYDVTGVRDIIVEGLKVHWSVPLKTVKEVSAAGYTGSVRKGRVGYRFFKVWCSGVNEFKNKWGVGNIPEGDEINGFNWKPTCVRDIRSPCWTCVYAVWFG